MAQVAVMVNGRSYTVACDEGQQEHLTDLARYVDKRVSDLAEAVGQVGEPRLLLMAGLMIADELSEMLTRIDELEEEVANLRSGRPVLPQKVQSAENAAAQLLEVAAKRIEDIATRMEAP